MNPEELSEKLDKYARKQGLELNRDNELVMDLMRGLLKNEERYGYRSCPCRLAKYDKEVDKDIICPCDYRDPDVRDYGTCYCGLYVSPDWNKSGKPFTRIPERRPEDKR
jgi:ferredoxin-thioredoxin reductase catalytic subunit